MSVATATNAHDWDSFLKEQSYSPFLQSWTMGEVYRATNQEPIRLEVRDANGALAGICMAIIVPARRGKHLSVPYGPVVTSPEALSELLEALQKAGKEHNCAFVRVSPFWPIESEYMQQLKKEAQNAPLHLLGEHIWNIPLNQHESEESIMQGMRKNTRNLIRRAKREGVEVTASDDPLRDLPLFLELHEETRKRHQFTPYTDAFFKAQVELFSKENACTLYIARYQGEVLATSVHMHFGGETSYHHGASTHAHPKIPASYLLQWTAITDALKRGDHMYSFWGIAPEGVKKHPFAGVTTFKRGFGGELLELVHCQDMPLTPKYYATKGFELVRKWKRGF